MGLIDSLFRRKETKAVVTNIDAPPFLMATAEAEKFSVPNPALYYNQASLYAKLSWIYAAVNIVSESASTVKFNVKQKDGEKLVDIPNHAFESLLQRPNPLDGYSDLIYSTCAYYKLNGNAYWWLNLIGGRPLEIWPIEPNKISPIPDGHQYISGYEYNTGSRMETIPTEQIVHFKRFNPLNRFVGLSAIESIAITATSDIALTKWNARLYGENNGRLPGIIGFKSQYSKVQWEQIQEWVRESAKDRNFMMLQNIGDGIEWIQNTSDPESLKMLESRQFTKEEIFSVLAPGLASTLSINATEANSTAGKATFMEHTIHPLLSQIAGKITNSILPMYGDKLVGEFDDVRVEDRELRMREIEIFSKSHTLDEIRSEFYQDEPLPDERGSLLVSQIGLAAAPTANVTNSGMENSQPAQNNLPALPEESGSEENTDETDETTEDLKKWQRKSLKALKARKSASVNFESDNIPATRASAIMGALEECDTAEMVKAIFEDAIAWRAYP